MRIYHTETQEDFNAFLKEKGIDANKMVDWEYFEEQTYIGLTPYNRACVFDINGLKLMYPKAQVIEYKAPKTRVERNSVKDLVKEVSKDNKEMYHAIIQELEQTYIAKNADYGNSFEQSLDKRGRVAGLVRIEDKLHRANNLAEGTKRNVIDESEQDTYLDMANYCIMMAMWLKKQANE